ncbi:response regulator transcription factor [bacterium]
MKRPLKIIIVDDNKESLKYIELLDDFFLSKEFMITIDNDPQNCIDVIFEQKPDLVLLSASVTNFDTASIVGILKKNRFTYCIPVIVYNFFIDANGDDEAEITALNLGVDDFVKAPFSSSILIARIKLAIKKNIAVKKAIPAEKDILKSGNIEINTNSHAVFVHRKLIYLTPKEFALLYLFIKRKNKVLNRVFLSETIWEHDYSNTTQTIDRHIANLRRKLGEEGRRIKTLPTIGYKFMEK